MYRYFWGEFPSFLTPLDMNKKIWSVGGKLRRWKRARIPLPVARALGKAVRDSLDENTCTTGGSTGQGVACL